MEIYRYFASQDLYRKEYDQLNKTMECILCDKNNTL